VTGEVLRGAGEVPRVTGEVLRGAGQVQSDDGTFPIGEGAVLDGAWAFLKRQCASDADVFATPAAPLATDAFVGASVADCSAALAPLGAHVVDHNANIALDSAKIAEEYADLATDHAVPAAQGLRPAARCARLARAMATLPKRDIRLLLNDARRVLCMGQRQFGEALGASHRTATRWDAGHSKPDDHSLRELARLLLPHDRALAIEAAAAFHETLESLGLEAPQAHAITAPLLVRPQDLVDVVVCCAAEMTGWAPSALRPVLHAVFKRAGEVGLSVEAAEQALRETGVEVLSRGRGRKALVAKGSEPAT
jgi:hypothetical protein